eukprot:CAMPEP_0114470952 /NCGR_PEP_ID=MMETSP0104-20121206/11542_1 /TAXON_ID=37642 ORGANISM="Paraphysomonas imperforata, Strain PA2" /NCGR_SAMPLE_ID=MMETSP0104 /ASSEMBLY_ACC=CAM_ASM_000202 /LENGTH=145 /DNA_ID=CAMNT_0001644743 /DNA_START=42 /DNA_END=479 /DNA_ORIENTATION=-
MVARAHAALLPSSDPYYPIPLVGPILAGAMTGSLGMFAPLDKGLAAVKTRVPWPLQGALITAGVYHLTIHDAEGYLGVWLRRALGFELWVMAGGARRGAGEAAQGGGSLHAVGDVGRDAVGTDSHLAGLQYFPAAVQSPVLGPPD